MCLTRPACLWMSRPWTASTHIFLSLINQNSLRYCKLLFQLIFSIWRPLTGDPLRAPLLTTTYQMLGWCRYFHVCWVILVVNLLACMRLMWYGSTICLKCMHSTSILSLYFCPTGGSIHCVITMNSVTRWRVRCFIVALWEVWWYIRFTNLKFELISPCKSGMCRRGCIPVQKFLVLKLNILDRW